MVSLVTVGNERSFAGKYCLVTGGTQGLGEATARRFAQMGAAGIVITGRNATKGKAVESALRELGTHALYFQADLGKSAECQGVIEAAEREFGQVDVLVNAAGSTQRGSIFDSTAEDFDQIMAVNARAPFLLMQGVIALMQRKGVKGSIVNVSSVVSAGGPEFLCPYSASKAALDALTRNIAYAVMWSNIRVNAVSPGWIDTPGEHQTRVSFHGAAETWLEEAEASQPFGRLIKVDELARMITYLASDESGVMTGSIVHYDQSVPGAGNPPQPVAGT